MGVVVKVVGRQPASPVREGVTQVWLRVANRAKCSGCFPKSIKVVTLHHHHPHYLYHHPSSTPLPLPPRPSKASRTTLPHHLLVFAVFLPSRATKIPYEVIRYIAY